METKQNVIISRIKKLMRHAESAKQLGSLEEAEVFSAKVEELMIEYNIELSQVKLEENEGEFDKWMYGEKVSYKDNQAGQRWRLNLVEVLCEYNFCNYTWNAYSHTFRVYGRMENVDTVVWMYNFLSIGLLRLAQEAHVKRDTMDQVMYRQNRYSFLKDWLIGAVVGLDRKFRLQREQSAHAEQIGGLVLFNKEALDRYLKIQNPSVRTVKMKTINVGTAYVKGVEAGENYSINPPLGRTKETKQLK